MKNKKIILVFLIALLSAYSFSNLYSKYQTKTVIDELSQNGVNHRINYNLSITLEIDEVLNNYDELVSNEGLVLFGYVNEGDKIYIKYYNPTKNTDFIDIVRNYEKKCSVNCIEFLEIEAKDFSIGSFGVQLFSASSIEKSIFDKYDLDVILIDEQESLYLGEDHIEEESVFEDIIREYYLYLVVNILVCTTLLLILFVTLISNIREISLHAIYGYSFKTLFLDFNKKYLKINLLVYFIIFNLLAFIFFRNTSIIIYSLGYTLLQLILVYILFICIQYSFYKNIKGNYQYKYIRKAIIILSVIISILTVLTVHFVDSSIKHTEKYVDTNEAFEISKNYYTLDHDMAMDVVTQVKISSDLINDHNAIYRNLYPIEVSGDYGYRVLEVDEKFFENNGIKDKEGNDIVGNINNLYLVDNNIIGGRETFTLGYMSLKVIQIKDTGLEYNTLDFENGNIKLDEVVIVVKEKETMLTSNVVLYSESREEAEEVFKKVYRDNGIEYEPAFHVVGSAGLKEEYAEKSISNISSAIIAFIAILISNISYAYLIFEHNKGEILLSNIYGHNYFNRMSSVLKESAIVVLITLTMMMVIGVYAALSYIVVLSIQFIVLNIVVKNLVGKLLVSNMKEEM